MGGRRLKAEAMQSQVWAGWGGETVSLKGIHERPWIGIGCDPNIVGADCVCCSLGVTVLCCVLRD